MIDRYLNQTVYIKGTANTYTAQGQPNPGDTLTPEPCRFQERTGRYVNSTGETVGTDAELWLQLTTLATLDRLVRVDGVQYRIVKMDAKRDISGNLHHYKALLIKHK